MSARMWNYENRSLISRQTVTTTAGATVVEALALMHSHCTSCLLVVADNELSSTLVGIFTERDLVRLAACQVDWRNLTLASVMTEQVITVKETEAQNIFILLDIFNRYKIRHLPVVEDNNNLVGIITPESIRQVIQPLDLLRQKQVSEVMSTSVVCAVASMSVLEIAQTMNQKRLSCVVIVEDTTVGENNFQDADFLSELMATLSQSTQSTREVIPIGIITERDIVQFCNMGLDLATAQAGVVMSTPLLEIKANDSVWFAHDLMQNHRVRRLIVKNEKGELAGLVTQTKILQAFDHLVIWQTLENLQVVVNDQTSELQQLNQQLRQEVKHRKLMEDKLRSSEMQIRAVFEAMTDIVIMVTTEGKQLASIQVLSANYHLGDNKSAIIASQTIEGFFNVATAQLWCDKVQQALDLQQRLDFDYNILSKENEIWFSASISPISTNSVLWVARDISQRKLTEVALQKSEIRERQKAQALEIANLELKRAETQLILEEKMVSLGKLVGGIAHEINNPANFIYGNILPAGEYVEELLRLISLYQQHFPQLPQEIIDQQDAINIEYIAEDFPKLLTSMKEGVERITYIVRSLEKFSRFDCNKSKKANIHEIIDSTLLLLEHRLKPQSNRWNIQVIKDYGLLPNIECFPGQLNQVFMSILSNAIDAIEEKVSTSEWGRPNIIINASTKPSFSSDCSSLIAPPLIRIRTQIIESKILIAISNNGTVIKPEILPKVFDPFFTTKPPGKGTGMGLSISYKVIVEEHRGQIRCNSLEGQGTEFVLELPIKPNP